MVSGLLCCDQVLVDAADGFLVCSAFDLRTTQAATQVDLAEPVFSLFINDQVDVSVGKASAGHDRLAKTFLLR